MHMKKQKQAPKQLAGWTPFQRAHYEPLPPDEEIARQAKLADVSFAEMKSVLEDIQLDQVYRNSRYQVCMRLREWDGFPAVWQLSIRRLDRQRVGTERYRDFLRVKNELIGPEFEAFEVYPAMERNVDTANQYYIWCFADPSIRLPVGFQEGSMRATKEGEKAVNAPFADGDLNFQHLNRKANASV